MDRWGRGEEGRGSHGTTVRDRGESTHKDFIPVRASNVRVESATMVRRETHVRMVMALAGTVRRRLTPMPRYRPLGPSSRIIRRKVVPMPSKPGAPATGAYF